MQLMPDLSDLLRRLIGDRQHMNTTHRLQDLARIFALVVRVCMARSLFDCRFYAPPVGQRYKATFITSSWACTLFESPTKCTESRCVRHELTRCNYNPPHDRLPDNTTLET
jgi:hypothetical protein